MNEQNSKRIRRNPEQWQELIDTQQASGLSAMTFCKEQSLGYASFCKWKNRLSGHQDKSGSIDEKDFIDLSSLHGSDSNRWQIVLRLGDGMELQLTRS